MHGRLKVKTSAQQNAEKQQERKVKVQAYRQAMSSILSRRADGLKDAKQLILTSQVLLSNPDIHTLWNIRRECATALIEESPSERDKLWSKEVELTQQCLMSNPKSYGAWHHRCYSLDQMTNPPWKKELKLCDKFLSMDERNFHCWDYRQIAAKKAGQSPEEELAFTMDRINSNFSNYSAWHYRSKLLPVTNPNLNTGSCHPIEEAMHHQELNLVQNAAFTDPDDSSAWLYHTWLLNREDPKLSLLYAKLKDGLLTIATNKEISSKDIKIWPESGDSTTPLNWKDDGVFKVQWEADFKFEGTICIEVNGETLKLPWSDKRTFVLGTGFTNLRFDSEPTEETRKILQEELDNCDQLLELEPESKWTNYTKAMLMKALDSNKYMEDILKIFDNLKAIDKLRKGYYEDQKCKFLIEKALEKTSDFDILDLSSLNLSKIYYKQYLNLFNEVKY